jgi:hypothetical protein
MRQADRRTGGQADRRTDRQTDSGQRTTGGYASEDLGGWSASGALRPVGAQSKDVKKAAGTITKADVARRIAIIADDSMMGRDTPSPGGR